MIPDPLHPAVVHFPIVFAVLLPVVTIVALVLIARGARFRQAWALPALVALGLAVASFAAVRTGEAQEDRVEDAVGETPMHEHEEAAEQFLLFSLIVAGIGVIGFARGNVGTAARWITTAGALALAFGGYRVGSSGGELVYEHGAASVYVSGAGTEGAIAAADDRGEGTFAAGEHEEDDDD